MIKLLSLILLFSFSNSSFGSFYLVYGTSEFSKTYFISDADRKIELKHESPYKLTFNDSDFDTSININLAKEGLAEYVVYDSVSLARDSDSSKAIYLLFDCLKNEEGRIVVILENNSIREIRDEDCKDL